MGALASNNLAQSTPAGIGWITLEEAARRSGKSVGHLRRLCGERWMAGGQARMERPEAGGKAAWMVREDADPALARVQMPEQIGTDLRPYTEAQRQVALRRKHILDQWLAARADGTDRGMTELRVTGRFLQFASEDGRPISRATLFNWHKRYRKGGLDALIDGRAKSQVPASDRQDDPFIQEVLRWYLDPKGRSLAYCYDIAEDLALRNGWTVCSKKTVERHIKSLPPALVILKREGEKAYTNKAAPYLNRDYSTLRSNEVWDADHHTFDVIVNCGTADQPLYKRPWLTAWQDGRSRKIVGWLIRAEDPNTEAIIQCLRLAIETHGVPDNAYTDNGKDFDSQVLTGQTKTMRWQRRKLHVAHDQQRLGGIYAGLDISHLHAWPYHGQSKPIERWFGTMEGRFGKSWDTYCGKDTASKPEDLYQHIERGHAPMLADFIAAFEQYLESAYHQDTHSGDSMEGKSPAQIWTACLVSKRTAARDLLDVLTLETTPPVKVGQNGVCYRGIYFGQFAPELHRLLGQQVLLRVDGRDLSSVQVWSLDRRFVCLAPANKRIPFLADKQVLADALAEKRQHRKALKQFQQARPHLADDLPERMIRAAASRASRNARASQPDGNPPPSIQPVRSPLEDQLPALQRAIQEQQLRPAVGAESLSPMSLRDAAARLRESRPAASDQDAPAGPRLSLVDAARELRGNGSGQDQNTADARGAREERDAREEKDAREEWGARAMSLHQEQQESESSEARASADALRQFKAAFRKSES
jgi:hypothetical protein